MRLKLHYIRDLDAVCPVEMRHTPTWHGDILAKRRRRVVAGEEGFMSIAESKRRLYEEVHAH